MNIFNFIKRRRSAPVARERLQILLEYERRLVGQSDLIAVLRDEIVAVVERHVVVDRDKVQVRVDRGVAVSILGVDVEIPNAVRAARERLTDPKNVRHGKGNYRKAGLKHERG
jgi:cell division topological specificity factor